MTDLAAPDHPTVLLDPRRPDFTARRFDVLAALRAESPVAFVPALGCWAVTSMREARRVLSDPHRFRSGGAFGASTHLVDAARAIYDVDRPLFSAIHLNTDGELHARLRGPVTAAFRPPRMRALQPDIDTEVTSMADHLFDAGPTADLVAGLARPLPMRTICRLLGLPLHHDTRMEAWNEAYAMYPVPTLPPDVQIGVAERLAEFENYIRDVVHRRVPLAPGLVAELLDGRATGAHDLTEDELVGSLGSIIFAGHETTVSTLANAFARLLGDRTPWAELAAGRADIDALTEEVLRLDTSVIGLYRMTTEPTELGGVPLPAGALLWVGFGAANRDPDTFTAPDTLQPGRARSSEQITFGHGIHYCIGAALARVQIRATLAIVPTRHPTLRLTGPVEEMPNQALRSTLAVPVTTD